jgi:hypothetical protein
MFLGLVVGTISLKRASLVRFLLSLVLGNKSNGGGVMAGKIDLFVNDTTGKVHVLERGSTSFVLCGVRVDGPISIRSFKPDIAIPVKNWCSHCIKRILKSVIAGRLYFQPVLDHALNRPAKKKKTFLAEIDSFRAEISFDDEEMTLKVLAGRSTGAESNFGIKAELELALSWDRLDNIRDITEETEEVKLTVFSMKPEEV